ncbi:MAG TPA: hypothetical protein VM529_14545 [Gemmata sp.]|nr:hypothetical protein [Gemmata sp.]
MSRAPIRPIPASSHVGTGNASSIEHTAGETAGRLMIASRSAMYSSRLVDIDWSATATSSGFRLPVNGHAMGW